MKKILLPIIVTIALFAASCKSSKNDPTPSSSDSYLPIASGSTWTYKDVYNGTTANLTIKMTGATAVFNGKTYYTATGISDKKGTTTGYFYVGNHFYSTRGSNAAVGLTVELQLGNDNEAVGYSWTTAPTDNGSVNSFPAKTINIIKEKGITKTINGNTFNDVIHTQIDLQYDLGGGFESFAIYDVYLAKGVGMVQLDTHIYDTLFESETITGYTIK